MTHEIFNAETMLALLPEQLGSSLTSSTAASELLTIAYQCSLYKEEGRDIRCRLLVLQNPADKELLDLLTLAQPVVLAVPVLRRLALATRDPDSAIVVDCTGGLWIVGLGTLTAVSTYLCALGYGKKPYEIACLGPAVIELTVDNVRVRFVRDRYSVPAMWKAAGAAVHSVSEEDLVRRASFPGIMGWIGYSMGHSVGPFEPELFGRYHDIIETQARAVAGVALAEYITALVDEIRGTASGGAVLIVPHLSSTDLLPLVTGHMVARPHGRYRDELWNAGVLNVFDWLLHLRMAHLDKVVATKDVKSGKEWIDTVGRQGFGEACKVQSSDARRVAQLTAIDGCVVVNGLMSPLMFGAKLKTVDIEALPEQIRTVVAGRGMRHRSMAATVGRLPETSGIVVSQDGDVTVFVNLDGAVCCHHEEASPSRAQAPPCAHSSRPRVPHTAEILLEILARADGEAG